jgi:hypothetical protein
MTWTRRREVQDILLNRGYTVTIVEAFSRYLDKARPGWDSSDLTLTSLFGLFGKWYLAPNGFFAIYGHDGDSFGRDRRFWP